jgi:hypothetical protein
MESFTQRHADKISGTISCFDRVILTGTIPSICYSKGITDFFCANGIRIFDFHEWAKPLREEIRSNAVNLAKEHGVDFVRKQNSFRKEARIKTILENRGDHPGLVHIFAAMETCSTYRPWHDKKTHKTFLKGDSSKCIHYYFYFIHAELGLCYLRVPTWAPFRLQFYFNGHYQRANSMRKKNIGFEIQENAFIRIDDFEKAQDLADKINVKKLHRILEQASRVYCPVIKRFRQGYHWSIMQAEYATDIIFKQRDALSPVYDELVRTLSHAIKPDQLATFLGRKVHGNFKGEMGNRFSTRTEGKCIKHHMGASAIKMYDKFGFVLRIETTTNNVTEFKHYRRVEHRDGTWEMKYAPMKKTIYSLPDLADLLFAANRRYLDFIAAVDDPTNGIRQVERLSRRVKDNGRSYKGFNIFDKADEALLRTLSRGEFNVCGFRNRDVRRHVKGKSSG